jgi:hypothetical protein
MEIILFIIFGITSTIIAGLLCDKLQLSGTATIICCVLATSSFVILWEHYNLFVDDKPKTFTGYLVAKEYTPQHMSNENERTVSYSVFIPTVVHNNPPPPHKVNSSFVWYVANKHQVISKNVDSLRFDTKKCGQLVTVAY